MTAGLFQQAPRQPELATTTLERKGLTLETGAPVTEALCLGTGVVVGFGDGSVRFFRPQEPVRVVEAHRGPVLSLATDAATGAVFTGGDDGRVLRLTMDGAMEELATFGTRWVDCVAAAPGYYACSSGKTAHVWRAGKASAQVFEHPSTVGGLAFDAKARRLAMGHYGGATVWERGERRWKSTKLET